METRFCEGQSSKGNNSKNINARVSVLALCTSSNVDTCMKFREDSFRDFQVTERTRFVTDRRTSGRPGKNNMSPNPSGGDINISSETAETVNFHFSHYKSIETISCHSNQSSYPTGIKNTTFVEAYVLSMYAKFQLHPPYGF